MYMKDSDSMCSVMVDLGFYTDFVCNMTEPDLSFIKSDIDLSEQSVAAAPETAATSVQPPAPANAEVAAVEQENVLLVKDDPALAKYFKMLKLGIVEPAVKQKMQSEGFDPALLEIGNAMSTSSRLRLSWRKYLQDFKDLEEIGRGGFGVVYAATQPNGERVALKKNWFGFVPHISRTYSTNSCQICSRAAAERIKNEIRAIRCLRHPNIVQFFEDFVDGNDTYVVMELCELGSMRSYVKKNGPLSDRAAAYVLRQIISAVKYMHREGILHRDLSSGNVLISRIFSPEKISVKLCDFGLATHLRKGETACTVVGTPGYIAPQVFKQEYDQAADVYSLGGVLYTMLTGNDPPSKGSSFFLFVTYSFCGLK
ncbi:kinase domain protein [Ancylostoma caninum]|uniref:Kinase domain protein n=1 Tax=Ancylostoma caninum TaxID=29170 RepID=A0A368GN62_ANCCA|nr:kinase domain protein [Ancylostoma caninum]